MRKAIFTAAAFAALFLASTRAVRAENVRERLDGATLAFHEMMDAPDQGIPQDLLRKAKCVVVVPGVKKAAFVVGGKFGRGFMSCRNEAGNWSLPAAMRMEGGSVGWQIGASESDVILLVMNESGMHRLLQSKFTLGAGAEVAAGPVGRTVTAETDAKMTAQILSWSRSRGVFAGVALHGATLREDRDENQALYGRRWTNREIVSGKVHNPRGASEFSAVLNKYTG